VSATLLWGHSGEQYIRIYEGYVLWDMVGSYIAGTAMVMLLLGYSGEQYIRNYEGYVLWDVLGSYISETTRVMLL
jgi:hypothetical protein